MLPKVGRTPFKLSFSFNSLVRHAGLSTVGGWIMGSAEAISLGSFGSDGAMGLLFSLCAGGGSVALVCAVIGALQYLLFVPFAAVVERLRIRQMLGPYFTRDPNSDRAPVLTLHGIAAAALIFAAAGLGLFRLAAPAFERIEDPALLFSLTVSATAAFFAAAIIGVALVSKALKAPLRWVDRRLGLPFPPSPRLRFALYGALPAFALLGSVIHSFSDALEMRILAAWVIGFFFVQGLLHHLRQILRQSAGGRWSGRLALLLCLGFTALGYVLPIPLRRSLSADSPSGAAVLLMRAVSDLDRDGASSFLGGGDCAGLDPAIHPQAKEIPNNGVDEDCRYGDETRAAGAKSSFKPEQPYVGFLDEKLVRDYNVIWIVVEALRADHVSAVASDSPRRTTPRLERLAQESLVFANAFAQSSTTRFSFASMLTGKNSLTMQWEARSSARHPNPSSSYRMFTEMVRKQGYRTGVVVSEFLKKFHPWVGKGSQVFDDFNLDGNKFPWVNRAAPITVSKSLEFLYRDDKFGKKETKPFFLLAYFYDPHAKYIEREDEGIIDFGEHNIDNYDEEILFTDMHIGFLLDTLRYQPRVWDKTIVVVTGDHGEEFEEHGARYHSRTCYSESIHVPLLLRVPGIEPKRVESNVGLIDIVPTLVELLDLKNAPADQFEGQSLLAPVLDDRRVDPDRPLFCGIVPRRSGLGSYFRRSTLMGRWKLIVDEISGTSELFDLAADPGEKTNLFERPEHAAKIKQLRAAHDSVSVGNMMDFHWQE